MVNSTWNVNKRKIRPCMVLQIRRPNDFVPLRGYFLGTLHLPIQQTCWFQFSWYSYTGPSRRDTLLYSFFFFFFLYWLHSESSHKQNGTDNWTAMLFVIFFFPSNGQCCNDIWQKLWRRINKNQESTEKVWKY